MPIPSQTSATNPANDNISALKGAKKMESVLEYENNIEGPLTIEERASFIQYCELSRVLFISKEEQKIIPKPLYSVFSERSIIAVIRHRRFKEVLAQGLQRKAAWQLEVARDG